MLTQPSMQLVLVSFIIGFFAGIGWWLANRILGALFK